MKTVKRKTKDIRSTEKDGTNEQNQKSIIYL